MSMRMSGGARRPRLQNDKEKQKLGLKKIFRNNAWLIGRTFRYAPSYVFLVLIQAIVWGIFNTLNTFFTKEIFDTIGEGSELIPAMQLIILFAIVQVVFWLYNRWYWQICNPKLQQRVHFKMHADLFRKAVDIDLEKYDDPKFYNDFIWAMDNADVRARGMTEDTGTCLETFISSAGLATVLFSVDALLGSIVFGAAALRVVVASLKNKMNFAYGKELNPLNRKTGYFTRVFKLADYAKELRTTHAAERLEEEYSAAVDEKNALLCRYRNRSYAIAIGEQILGIGVDSLVLIIALYKVMVTGEIGLGGLAVAINSIWRMSWYMRTAVEKFLRYEEHALYTENIIEFTRSMPEIKYGEVEAGEFESLSIRDLTFSYKGKEDAMPALSNVNMEIRRGEKIAIVGYNGAGKTTLTKLIMHLYEQSSGEILYNGKPLSHYTRESIRTRMAAVFQDYRIFAASLAENVTGGYYDPEKDRAEVLDALEKSTFTDKLNSLSAGLDTQMTREFDKEGTLLSGGESQKVAIARAFCKNSDLIILDEPSSALDPDAEYALNSSIMETSESKTVVFISHRLSTTRHADRIYMFDGGRLIESGTHSELMAMDGKYAYMFNLQAEKYAVG